MKFGPKNLRFTLPIWTVFRRPVYFLSRGNTLHLQETALVVEGNLIRFRLFIFDRLMQRMFSERSMITLPYSRIVSHRYCRYWTAKVLWWLFALGLLGIAVLAEALAPGTVLSLESEELFFLISTSLSLVLVGVLIHWLLRPRHVLVFRRADGKRALLCFRFTARKPRRQFVDLLKENREAARASQDMTMSAAKATGGCRNAS